MSTAESITVAGVPPPTGTTLRAGGAPVAVSVATNPRREPSGEKNGSTAPSAPATGVAWSWSRLRTHNRVAPTYARYSPLGETAIRKKLLSLDASASASGRAMLYRDTAPSALERGERTITAIATTTAP